jgi:hypothetical protein
VPSRVIRVITYVVAFATAVQVAIADTIPAPPSYSASYVSLTYTGTTGAQLEDFTFVGPNLNLTGGGGSPGNGLLEVGILPGTPFFLGQPLIEGEYGVASAAGAIAGVTYNDLGVSSGDGVYAGPFVLQNGETSLTVPYTLTGTVGVCRPYVVFGSCEFTAGQQYFNIAFSTPGLMTVHLIEIGSASQSYWAITSAQFTSVPEPNTGSLIICMFIVGCMCSFGGFRLCKSIHISKQ